jgi:transcriptional regulator with GAF, ATPase, and Fis domain
LTSELFGHAKGAFTGADRDRAGHAEVADGGTLFLDEIGDLPLELQPKLLTFLQDRTIQRLGSSQVRKVDVRLIVATHRDLAEMCREHQFRQDLYFRLMVLSIELPPLRHRAKELPSLAEGILERICKRMGMGAKRLSESSMGVLLDHDWPGNIRELENVLERAAAFCNGDLIQPHDLILSHVALDRRARRAESPSAARTPASTNAGPNTEHCRSEGEEVVEAHRNPPAIRKTELPGNESGRDAEARTPHPACSLSRCECLAGKTLDEIERLAIVQTLQACRGNKAKSARMLGISEKSVYNKMRRLNIDNSDMSVGPIPSTATVPATQSIGAR